MTATFGDLLRQLRRRAGMTQTDLAAAVGFSEAQISRLEKNLRLPNLEVIATVFVAALGLQEEPQAALRLVELAALARGEKPPTTLTIQREVRQIAAEEIHTEIHAVPGHLPIPPTPLIGREQDLDLICKRIVGHHGRLFTLIGPPGVGKTRLALAVASQLQPLYAGGAYFVPLAAMNDTALLPTVLAATLGLTDNPAKAPRARLIEFLRYKQLLLLLDNFEQLGGAAPFVAELLEECGGLHILVTSRAALKVRGEQRYPVAPLQPAAAVALFTACAQNIDPTFAPSLPEQATLEAICRRLDCLPLALELSATQLDLCSPQQLLTRLSAGRLDLLAAGPADLPAHHQTLRRAIQRSYELLNEAEQRLFRSLSIFMGSFALAAVQSSGFEERMLQGLLQKSLVHPASSVGEQRRFLLLETLREFAGEKLQERGEGTITAQRHADYFLMVAESAAQQMQGKGKGHWLPRLDADLENLRAAFGWFCDHTPAQAVALAGALKEFWYLRGYLQEGRAWLTQALTLADSGRATHEDLPPEHWLGWRARSLLAGAQLAQNQGDCQQALQWVDESIALYRQLGNRWGVAEALRESGWVTYGLHQRQTTVARFEESLQLFRAIGDQAKIAAVLTALVYLQAGQELDHERSLAYLRESVALLRVTDETDALYFAINAQGEMELHHGNYSVAETLFTESLTLAHRLGARREIAIVLTGLSKVKLYQEEAQSALRYAQEGLQIAQTIGDKDRCMNGWCSLGHAHHALGDLPAALACYGEALRLCLALENRHFTVECLLHCGEIAAIWGNQHLAAQLLAATQQLLDSLPPYLKPMDRSQFIQLVENTRTALGESDFAVAWLVGEGWSFAETVTAARAFCRTPYAPPSTIPQSRLDDTVLPV